MQGPSAEHYADWKSFQTKSSSASATPFADSWASIEKLAMAATATPPLAPSAPLPSTVTVVVADYADPVHSRLVGELLDDYAADEMGDGERLPHEILSQLASRLAEVPNAFSVLAWVDGAPAGLANVFQGFSTFKCKPLLNIHDCFVRAQYRRSGVCSRMLAEVERIARERHCCKVTLEVLSQNLPAQAAYRRAGFAPYELDPKAGHALYWQRMIDQMVPGGADGGAKGKAVVGLE